MRPRIALAAGTLLISAGLLGASLTFTAERARADDGAQSATHQQMDRMMEECSTAMANMMNGNDSMMTGTPGTTDGTMDDMMNGTPEATDGTPTP